MKDHAILALFPPQLFCVYLCAVPILTVDSEDRSRREGQEHEMLGWKCEKIGGKCRTAVLHFLWKQKQEQHVREDRQHKNTIGHNWSTLQPYLTAFKLDSLCIHTLLTLLLTLFYF